MYEDKKSACALIFRQVSSAQEDHEGAGWKPGGGSPGKRSTGAIQCAIETV